MDTKRRPWDSPGLSGLMRWHSQNPSSRWVSRSTPRSQTRVACFFPANPVPFRYLLIMNDALVINEIYLSLQGESTLAGVPCRFIRLTSCDLRRSYCDTAYAFTVG